MLIKKDLKMLSNYSMMRHLYFKPSGMLNPKGKTFISSLLSATTRTPIMLVSGSDYDELFIHRVWEVMIHIDMDILN